MRVFDVGEVDRAGIEDRHKIAIADCIMAWAAVDCQLRALVTSIEGRTLDQGAVDYNRLPTQVAWGKLRQRLRDQGATRDVLAMIKLHKKSYLKHVEARNLIAHAGCVGVRREDRDYLVFAPFEAYAPGQMAIVCQPLNVIHESTEWARAFTNMAHTLMERLGH